MKNLIERCRYFFFSIAVLLIAGCGMFDKMGAHLASGVSTKTDTLGMNLVKGLSNQLADPATKKHITNLLDSIVISLDSTLEPRVQGMVRGAVGNVVNHKVILWSDSLVEALTGQHLKLNVKALQYELVGKTKTDILQIRNSFKELLNDILSEDTDNKLGKLRDELLGAKTDSAISHIVDHAAAKVIDQINSKLNPTLKGDVSYVGKYGGYLLLALGGIAVIIILVVWWSKRRYLKMVTLLTKHIHNIPDQKVYDTVTAKIKDEAISTGLEPSLRKILAANGLLGSANWNNKEKD